MDRCPGLDRWGGGSPLAFGGGLGCFATAVGLGGNGFIAAFVCGVVLRYVVGERFGNAVELAEDVGQLGASVTFVLFGALMVWPAFGVLSWPIAICAVATLAFGRMIPVALAMIGAELKAPTIVFLGWFGPRGLASMLFGLLVVVERGREADQLFSIIALVVFASVVLHGATAAPGARAYARWFARNEEALDAETPAMAELRLRWNRLHLTEQPLVRRPRHERDHS